MNSLMRGRDKTQKSAKQHSEWLSLQKKESLERGLMTKVTAQIQAEQSERQNEQVKQQTLHAVAQQFPQAFAKDANGRLVDLGC